MTENRRPPGLTEEQTRLLGGSFAEYSDYFNRFTSQHFPQLNLIMLDAQDPDRDKRLYDAIIGMLDKPHVQARMTDISYTDALPLMHDYASDIIFHSNRSDQKTAEYAKETGSDLKMVGGYQPNFPHNDISRIGAQVAPITVDNGHCTSCKPQNNLLSCTDMPSASGLENQMQRVATGFHEIAHAVAVNGRSMPGLMIENFFKDKHYSNRMESEANSFETLMMVREFGDMGLAFTRLKQHGAGLDASHATYRAVAATHDWIGQNRDKLQTMSPAELYKIASHIGNEYALTKDEYKLADTFLRNYSNSSHYDESVVQGRQDAAIRFLNGAGPEVPNYNIIGYEIDRMYLTHTRNLPANLSAFDKLSTTALSCSPPQRNMVDLSNLGQSLQQPENPPPALATELPVQPAQQKPRLGPPSPV